MNVSIGERWQGFVERVVSEGRYGSASEVVREGLRLVEEREAKLLALRTALDDSIARGARYRCGARRRAGDEKRRIDAEGRRRVRRARFSRPLAPTFLLGILTYIAESTGSIAV